MSNEIRNDGIDKLRGLSSIPPIRSEEETPHVDSGASVIEKSKAIHAEVVPSMNSPILAAPSQQCEAFAVASLDATGRPMTSTIHSFVLKGEEVKNSVLEGWMNNLREIEEYVRQLLVSPMYQQLQETLRKGDPQLGVVSGIQGAASANAAARGEGVELLSALDRLQVLERVPSSAEVSGISPSADSSAVLVLPLTAALLAGGGVAIGTEVVQGVNPLSGVMEMVANLQPLFPTVSVQDFVPLINLMIVGPLYFNSWNEAVSSLKNRERHNHLPAIQNFSKDVIKIVTDPHFVNHVLVNKMKGTEHLSQVDQDRLTRMLKVVLVGVALSLLYSAEVGKVQSGQFGGMEAEELRDLLLGKFTEFDSSKKLSEHEQLTTSLIARAWEQLKPLSVEDRTAAVNMLLDYVAKKRDLDPMLDPAKVFDEAINATLDPKGKMGNMKA